MNLEPPRKGVPECGRKRLEVGAKVTPVMAIRNPTELKEILRPGARLMGLDVGTKTIGLAISDASLTVASPLETIRRRSLNEDAAALKRIIDARNVGALVLGLPVEMSGREGPRCQSVRQFAANLMAKFDIDIAFWDERLSTSAVERDMIEADLSRRKRASVVDKVAAAYILQGVLERIRGPAPA